MCSVTCCHKLPAYDQQRAVHEVSPFQEVVLGPWAVHSVSKPTVAAVVFVGVCVQCSCRVLGPLPPSRCGFGAVECEPLAGYGTVLFWPDMELSSSG